MAPARPENKKLVIPEGLLTDDVIFYVNDYALPYITKDGNIVYESYNAPSFYIDVSEESVCIGTILAMYASKDISVSIADNTLVISGKRCIHKDMRTDNPKAFETFYREIYVPRSLDEEHIRVTFKNNELRIVIPKIIQKQQRIFKIEE